MAGACGNGHVIFAHVIEKRHSIYIRTVAHCAFSANLLHGQIDKNLSTNRDPQKTKNVALEKGDSY